MTKPTGAHPPREADRSNAPVMLLSLHHPLREFQKGLLGVEITWPATGPACRPKDAWPHSHRLTEPLLLRNIHASSHLTQCQALTWDYPTGKPNHSPVASRQRQAPFILQRDNDSVWLGYNTRSRQELAFPSSRVSATRLRTYRMLGPLNVRSWVSLPLDQGIPRYSTTWHCSLDNTLLSDDGLLQAKPLNAEAETSAWISVQFSHSVMSDSLQPHGL